MKHARFTEKIIGILAEQEARVKCTDLCLKDGMSESPFYHWKLRFGVTTESEAIRLRALENEYAKLMKLLAEQMLDLAAMKTSPVLAQIGVSDPLSRWIQQRFVSPPASGLFMRLETAQCVNASAATCRTSRRMSTRSVRAGSSHGSRLRLLALGEGDHGLPQPSRAPIR